MFYIFEHFLKILKNILFVTEGYFRYFKYKIKKIKNILNIGLKPIKKIVVSSFFTTKPQTPLPP